jgi:DNA-binding CsgD family transcriptional regulator
MTDRRGLVLFGDVTDSRVEAARATAWLRMLSRDLDRHYAGDRLAPFGFTQGDEIQGLLALRADPTAAVLRGALHAHAMPMRWVIVAGRIEAGRGPATQRTGRAFIDARELVSVARKRRRDLLVRSGDAATDELLDDVAPALAALLAALTGRQRTIAQLVLVDGLRQSDAAHLLGVSRPTVSVAVERARIREIGGLARAIQRLLAGGVAAAEAAADGAGPPAGPPGVPPAQATGGIGARA